MEETKEDKEEDYDPTERIFTKMVELDFPKDTIKLVSDTYRQMLSAAEIREYIELFYG